MFVHRKINCLLLHSVNYMARPGADYYRKERFIKFVVRYGNKDIIELDKDGKPISIRPTPMHDAARLKLLQRNEMVRKLFKKYERLKVDYVDDPLLSLAIKKELKNVIEFLLKVGADPNSANNQRSTPLHLICADDDGFMEHFLDTCKSINAPVQVNAQDFEDKTPLHIALVRVKETHHEWLHDRLQEICLEAQNASDRPSQRMTVDDESVRSVELLLRAGADPNVADAEGSTALHVICKRDDDNDNLMKMLFAICDEVGMTVQVDVQDNADNTPLHLALKKAHIALTEVLLKRDADPNVANNEGNRPLHVICNRKIDDNLMKLFLELCKDLNNKMLVDLENELHKTPLQLAVEYLMPDVVYALLHYGTDLPSFVFPSAADFKEYLTVKMFESPRSRLRCDVITDALFVIRHLESAKCELDLNEAVMIMSVFAECGSFEMSASLVERLSREKYFSMEAQKIQTSEGLSLYDLMKLPIDEAARRFNYKDFKSTLRTLGVMARNDRAKLDAVAGAISLREFFQNCAVEAFWELTHQRIPIECCTMIIDKLAIEDLYHICLAFASLSQ
uniref:Uncharacterized protein n=1 Tax=Trichogramma kaykai TaxID=54128 RepID=A0ABD2X2N1_9HYME